MSLRSLKSPSNNPNRPILVVSNSSWYLLHYRKLLLKKLKKNYKYILAMSPIDSSTNKLSQILLHIPWRIYRSSGLSPLSLMSSLIRMIFIVRALKPLLIHSHTLKANLITSIVSSFYGIPTIYSFAGMGRLSSESNLKKVFFKIIIKLIFFFSSLQRVSKYKLRKEEFRCKYIFQNPRDMKLVKSIIKPNKKVSSNLFLIPGSGLPDDYLRKNIEVKNNWLDINPLNNNLFKDNKIDFIYCGRLIKSKGIFDYIKMASGDKINNYFVYGDLDKLSKKNIESLNLFHLKLKYQNLIFKGNVKNPLLNHLKSFPILLLLSNYGEGLPRTILEAMSLSIPVISTKIAACDIFDSRYIYLLDSNSQEEITSVVGQIKKDFHNGDLKIKLDKAKDLTTENFNEFKIVKETLKIYSKQLDLQNTNYLNLKDLDDLNEWIAK